jgi:hypothetical protein
MSHPCSSQRCSTPEPYCCVAYTSMGTITFIFSTAVMNVKGKLVICVFTGVPNRIQSIANPSLCGLSAEDS